LTQKILLLINLGGGGYNPRNPPFAYGPGRNLCYLRTTNG